MYVDVEHTSAGTSTQWTAESGLLDLFLLLGPSPRQVSSAASAVQQSADLQYFRSRFSLPRRLAQSVSQSESHHCRWDPARARRLLPCLPSNGQACCTSFAEASHSYSFAALAQVS